MRNVSKKKVDREDLLLSVLNLEGHITTDEAVRLIGVSQATVRRMFLELEKNGKIHPSLKEGFSKLYGYTNDGDGIRHAMLDEPTLTQGDAKYFLLSCTSFVNYLKFALSQ